MPKRTASGQEPGKPDKESAQRQRAIDLVMREVVRRRAKGELLPDEAVIQEHPELEPELGAELAAMREIHRGFLAAQRAGQAAPVTATASTPTAAAVSTPAAAPVPRPAGPASLQVTAADASPEPHIPVLSIQGYAHLQEINSGGQGTVFKGVQEATGRAVAIKVLAGGPLTGSRHRARFDRESQIMAALDHPHIVGILDRGRTADGSWFLVMPYIDGCMLDEHLERLGSKDVAAVLRLFVLIANAVADAHAKGIVHRDLKPPNIRIDGRGEPHILDFGLARLMPNPMDGKASAREVTQTGQIVGSLPWASPEQVSRGTEQVQQPTDVYALGVMLYQALAGKFPYSVIGSVHEVLDNILKAKPAPPSQARSALSKQIGPGLDAIVLKALAKSPADRYPGARELAEDLQRYLDGMKPVAATGAGKWLPMAVVAGAAALLLVGTGVAILMQRSHSATSADAGDGGAREITNRYGIHLVRVDSGEFMMGSPLREVGRSEGELLHEAKVAGPFYIGATEVTQEQYTKVMGSLPCPQPFVGGELPVQGVTWREATEFCRVLSEREGRTYRLPGEKQWEYACRASSEWKPFSGSGKLEEMGWYQANAEGQPHRAGLKRANAWGLSDMHGNVREWCRDAYWEMYLMDDQEERATPPDPRYVLRGGSYLRAAGDCRSASREPGLPEVRLDDAGFRVVMELP